MMNLMKSRRHIQTDLDWTILEFERPNQALLYRLALVRQEYARTDKVLSALCVLMVIVIPVCPLVAIMYDHFYPGKLANDERTHLLGILFGLWVGMGMIQIVALYKLSYRAWRKGKRLSATHPASYLPL